MTSQIDSTSVGCYKDLNGKIAECLASLKKKLSGGNDLKNLSNGPRESDVGVTEFLQVTEGSFNGIIKFRWSDFVVSEIDDAGEVVEITNQTVPFNVPTECEVSVRPDWFPEDAWSELVELDEGGSVKGEDNVSICVNTFDKEKRKEFHTTIKRAFKKVVSNTCDVDGVKMIIVRRIGSRNKCSDTFWKHKPWPKDRPKILHFSMQKQCLDTFSALSLLAQSLRVNPKQFSFAGSKDARALTCQRVSIKQVSAERLLNAANAHACVAKLKVGNFCYKNVSLRLGDLVGNRFQLALRNVTGSRELIGQRIECFQRAGFVNYFGLQRFGTRHTSTHMVGRALLQRRWSLAVDLLLSSAIARDRVPQSSESSLVAAQLVWLTERDAARALALLTPRERRTTVEGRLLHRLASLGAAACREALDSLPAGSRSLYVHAYQSWVWNCVVSKRLRRHGQSLVAGDLVLAPPVAIDVEERVEDGADKDDGDGDNDDSSSTHDTESDCTNTVCSEVDANESDISVADVIAPSSVLVLKESDIARFNFSDLVIPLPGWSVTLPGNETADDIRDILASDEVVLDRVDSAMKSLCSGSYRRVIGCPRDIDWNLVHYDRPDQDLIGVRSSDCAEGWFRALILRFCLAKSSYATMALREITGSDTSLESQLELNRKYQAMFLDKSGSSSKHAISTEKLCPPNESCKSDDSIGSTDVGIGMKVGSETMNNSSCQLQCSVKRSSDAVDSSLNKKPR